MTPRVLQMLGICVAVPLMVFAVHENLWAEPLPEKEVIKPAFQIEMPEEEENTMGVIEDMDLLAAVVEAEAGNQSELGRRLVVDVILNRIDNPNFPDTLREVLEQPGQFATVTTGMVEAVTPSFTTWQAINTEWINRIDNEVLYFRTGHYTEYGTPYERVGDHYFSK